MASESSVTVSPSESFESSALNKVGRMRLWIAIMAFLAYMVAFFDRSNVAVLIADINFTDFFGITADKSTQGLLLTSFLLFYGVACFFAGPFVHRFGAKKALAYGLLAWAVLMAVMGSISSVVMLLACRALLGIGEAVLGPSVSKLVQTWFPVQERARVNGTWFLGFLLAQVLAIPLVTWFVTGSGWRGSFFILALMGVVPIVGTFLAVYDVPSKHPRISRREIEYISGGVAESGTGLVKAVGGFGFIKESNFWFVAIVYAIANAIGWGLIGWIPTYFKATLGFSFAKMGLVAALPWLVGAASVILFTPMMDKFNSRAPFAILGFIGFGVCLFIAMNASDTILAVTTFCLANAFFMPLAPALFTILQNTTKSSEVANATGFFNGIAYIFAAVFPFLMGALYTHTGDLRNGFYLLVAVTAIAVFVTIPLVKRRL